MISLICGIKIISCIEHLFMYLLAMYRLSLEKHLFRPIVLSELFVFWYWASWAVCKFWRLITCWLNCLQIFSPILLGCLFVIVRYHLTSVRMAIMKKSTNNKFWNGCGGKGTLLHCWWERKLVQPLWRTVWRVLKKTKNRATIWSSNPMQQNCVWHKPSWRRSPLTPS